MQKGDVKTERFLVECKFTDKTQYVLKLDTLNKIAKEALQAGREPLLSLDIYGKQFFVVPREVFLELVKADM